MSELIGGSYKRVTGKDGKEYLVEPKKYSGKTYTVTQKGGYQALRTFDKAEAGATLKELQERSGSGIDCWYICEQGRGD